VSRLSSVFLLVWLVLYSFCKQMQKIKLLQLLFLHMQGSLLFHSANFVMGKHYFCFLVIHLQTFNFNSRFPFHCHLCSLSTIEIRIRLSAYSSFLDKVASSFWAITSLTATDNRGFNTDDVGSHGCLRTTTGFLFACHNFSGFFEAVFLNGRLPFLTPTNRVAHICIFFVALSFLCPPKSHWMGEK